MIKINFYKNVAPTVTSTLTNAQQTPLLRVTDSSTNASTTLAIFENSFGMSCVIEGQTASLACSSDASLKKNKATIDGEDALAAVLALDPVKFDWILNGPSEDDYVMDENGEYVLDENGNRTVKEGAYSGFIAQDVEQIELLKGLVTDVGGKKALQYDRFVPYIVRAFQEFAHTVDGFLVTLESGWKRLTANELCLLDENKDPSELVCVTSDQLRAIGAGAAHEDAVEETPVEETPIVEEEESEPQVETSETPAEEVTSEEQTSPIDIGGVEKPIGETPTEEVPAGVAEEEEDSGELGEEEEVAELFEETPIEEDEESAEEEPIVETVATEPVVDPAQEDLPTDLPAEVSAQTGTAEGTTP